MDGGSVTTDPQDALARFQKPRIVPVSRQIMIAPGNSRLQQALVGDHRSFPGNQERAHCLGCRKAGYIGFMVWRALPVGQTLSPLLGSRHQSLGCIIAINLSECSAAIAGLFDDIITPLRYLTRPYGGPNKKEQDITLSRIYWLKIYQDRLKYACHFIKNSRSSVPSFSAHALT